MPTSSRATPRLLIDEHFAALEDPRDPAKVAHTLRNVLIFALAAVLCGATGWDDMALLAHEQRAALADLLDPCDRAPSADTFRRLFEVLHPDAFAAAFAAWTASLARAVVGEVVAFDGKRHRGTTPGQGGAAALQTVTAWATAQRLALHHEVVPNAASEGAGIVALLAVLRLPGAIVTTDAGNCNAEVAAAARAAAADYLLALKANRARLYVACVAAFAAARAGDAAFAGDVDTRTAGGHGRRELRQVWTLPASALGAAADALPDLRTIVYVRRLRGTPQGVAADDAYYVTSLASTARALGDAIRAHWGIENDLHRTLDVVFGEDTSGVRDVVAANNLGLVRRIAEARLRRDPTKLSLRMKTRRATVNVAYLRELLTAPSDA